MKPPRLLTCLLILTVLCAISGCGEVTIGPRTEIRTVIVKPGQPVRILENVTVKGERMDTHAIFKIDIGGWVTMPEEHWNAVLKEHGLEKATP